MGKTHTHALPDHDDSMTEERHPFEPFLPTGARLLMLGTFPPSRKRWCMDFYYPNFQNDMWRIFGLCFFGDKEHFVVDGERRFDKERLTEFLSERGVALFDTAVRVRRTKDTAADKDLEIVEQTDIDGLLRRLPQCHAVATAGQLATATLCSRYGMAEPRVGSHTDFEACGRKMQLHRLPSSSRAYPLSIERKAESYQRLFDSIGIL